VTVRKTEYPNYLIAKPSFVKLFQRYFKYSFNYFFNVIDYYIVNYKQRRKNIPLTKSLMIDFKSNFIRRNLALITFWFAEQGYTVYYHNSFKSVGSMSLYDRLVFRLPQFRLTMKIKTGADIILTNRIKRKYLSKTVQVDNYYWEDEEIDTWHVPEGMHPLMYYNNLIPDLNIIQDNPERNIGVFFSGNLDTKSYNRPVIQEKFGLLSRSRVIEILKKNFNNKELIIPDSISELYKSDFSKRIILNDRRKNKIEQKDFLQLLSLCKFFLFTPGVSFPLCHNNFEAMAAGCIPILQYPNYHFPNLQDGVNCLVFKNDIELISKIKIALNMGDLEVQSLSNEVVKYYKRYLTPEAIVSNIEIKVISGEINKLIILQG